MTDSGHLKSEYRSTSCARRTVPLKGLRGASSYFVDLCIAEMPSGDKMDLNSEFSGSFGNGFRLRSGLLDSGHEWNKTKRPHTCTADALLLTFVHNFVQNR